MNTSQLHTPPPPATAGGPPSQPAYPYPVAGNGGQPFVQQSTAQPGFNTMVAPAPMQAMPTLQMHTQTIQPGAVPGMDIRNVKGLERDFQGQRQWSHGCCGFLDDCGTCMLGFCCPCIVYSQIKTRLSHLETRRQVHPSGGEAFSSDCFVHGFLTGCCGIGWVLQIGQRSSTRDRYRIRGNGCTDCMMAAFCSPCELTQESRELELEERALMGGAVSEKFQGV